MCEYRPRRTGIIHATLEDTTIDQPRVHIAYHVQATHKSWTHLPQATPPLFYTTFISSLLLPNDLQKKTGIIIISPPNTHHLSTDNTYKTGSACGGRGEKRKLAPTRTLHHKLEPPATMKPSIPNAPPSHKQALQSPGAHPGQGRVSAPRMIRTSTPAPSFSLEKQQPALARSLVLRQVHHSCPQAPKKVQHYPPKRHMLLDGATTTGTRWGYHYHSPDGGLTPLHIPRQGALRCQT